MNRKYSLWQFNSMQFEQPQSASPPRTTSNSSILNFRAAVKFRTLRVYIEKNAAERAKLAELAAAGTAETPEGRPGRAALRRNPRRLREVRAGLRNRTRRRRPDPRRRVHPRGLLARPRTQALQGRGLQPLSRQPGQASDLHSGQQQPALARPPDHIRRRHPDDRPLGRQAEGQGKEGRHRSDRRDRLANVEKANLVAEI